MPVSDWTGSKMPTETVYVILSVDNQCENVSSSNIAVVKPQVATCNVDPACSVIYDVCEHGGVRNACGRGIARM
jgi:hypothetical protein